MALPPRARELLSCILNPATAARPRESSNQNPRVGWRTLNLRHTQSLHHGERTNIHKVNIRGAFGVRLELDEEPFHDTHSNLSGLDAQGLLTIAWRSGDTP